MFRWTMLNFGLVSSLKLSPENGWSRNTCLFPLGFRPYFHGRNVAVRFRLQPTTLKFRRWLAGKPTMNEDSYLPTKKWWICHLVEAAPGRSFLGSTFGTRCDLFLGPQVLVATFFGSWNIREFPEISGKPPEIWPEIWPQVFLVLKKCWEWKTCDNRNEILLGFVLFFSGDVSLVLGSVNMVQPGYPICLK